MYISACRCKESARDLQFIRSASGVIPETYTGDSRGYENHDDDDSNDGDGDDGFVPGMSFVCVLRVLFSL